MSSLRKFLTNMEPHFEAGGKWEKYAPIFEMADTFLFTSAQTTDRGPHVRDALDLKRAMSVVIIAMIPALLFGFFNVGYQEDPSRSIVLNFLIGIKVMMPIIIVSYAAGGFWEVLFAIVRKHEINEGFLVTGLIIPMIVPPTTPLWMVAVATSFGIVIGKEIFGGTGFNIFNPALVARAFLFFAYPKAISGDQVWTIADGVSKATPLAVAAATPTVSESANSSIPFFDFVAGMFQQLESITNLFPNGVKQMASAGYSWSDMFFGFIPGSFGETSTFAILIGAFILIITKIGSWRVMLGILFGMIGMALITNIVAFGSNNPMMAITPQYHLVLGGFAFGAVFMATDPVSCAQSDAGRWIYGILIGALTVIIRSINPAFPEGMMLAILLGNAFAPLIDYYVLRHHIKKRKERYAQ